MKPVSDADESWDPTTDAITAAWTSGAGNAGRSVVRRIVALSHPSHPYRGDVDLDPSTGDRGAALFAFATRYLEVVGRAFGEPTGQEHDGALARACTLIAADAPGPDRCETVGFGWLRIGWGGPLPQAEADPRRSFWVERQRDGRIVDRTAVLLAAMRVDDGARQICLGGGIGLRVVMHVGTTPIVGASRFAARITGMTAVGLDRIPSPEAGAGVGPSTVLHLLRAVPSAAEAAFGFAPATASVNAVWFDPPSQRVWLGGSGLRLAAEREHVAEASAGAFDWAANARWDGTTPESVRLLDPVVVEQASAVVVSLPVFLRDPASAGGPGPIASEDLLESAPYRTPVPVNLPLCDDAVPMRFEVRQSVVADPRNDPTMPQDLNASDVQALRLRSDAQAAVHAFVRAREFFDRLECYGLPARQYFKHAALPLVLRHRAWFYEQPDGRVVNALVRPDRQTQSLHEDYSPAATPQLELRFGAAELSHRSLRPNDHGRDRAQPLGIAADPRIAWHEFGHVLSYAATGALEFHFAHSAGDALAAILGDPDSSLAVDVSCRARSDARAGQTYPWVQIARRHDRETRLGWCWCGQRNAMRHVPFRLPAPLFKDYVEEQLLSSSLFRLYRIVGGDTFSDLDRRRAAADYCVYLVMKAIALLGPAAVTPAIAAEQFVEALYAADIGTFGWAPQVPGGGARARQGGAAHKAIRWAFEQQGLFATDDPAKNVEGIGRPPKVDVFVAGRGERATGGYSPVELVWGDDDSPAWHADSSALSYPGQQQVVVHVRNRGSSPPGAITARAWAAAAARPGAPLQWKALAAPRPQQPLPEGSVAAFAFDTLVGGQPLQGRHIVLAEVDCAEDRSNLNPATTFECATPDPPADAARLIDLVANDNNLGLRMLDFV